VSTVGVLQAVVRSRRDLVLENPLLRQQLSVALRLRRRPRLRQRDRLFWCVARRVCADWRRHLVLVRPATVLRRHREAWRFFWWWRSRRPLGRPRVPREVRDLIATMSRDNPLWGTERIRGELRRLGLAVSAGSVRRCRWRRLARPPSQTWRSFLRNHAAHIWAADLYTVPTVTFRSLFVLFFVTHDRREHVHCRATAHPMAAWVWRQLIEATAWDRRPRNLLHDRDAVYGRDAPTQAQALGMHMLLTPYRAPRANVVASGSSGPSGTSAWTTCWSSMCGTWRVCSGSTSPTTTPIGSTAAWGWCRRFPAPRRCGPGPVRPPASALGPS
jgi:hypothetical protein